MGPGTSPPPFPDFFFTKLPANQVLGYQYRQECNFLQGIEADLDTSHPSFLHSTINQAPVDERRAAMSHDPRPRAYAREEPFGMQTVWGWRTADPNKALYWVDPFVMPCHTIVPAGRGGLRWIWHAWVPIDDEHHWLYYVHYDPDVDLSAEVREQLEYAFGHDLIDPADDYRSRANLANLHFLDRDRQKTETYTGIRGIAAQDIAMLQSMGPIVDRSRENIGSKDLLVARLRRYLLGQVRSFMAGAEPPALDGTVQFADIDSRMVIVPAETPLREILEHREWVWGDIAER